MPGDRDRPYVRDSSCGRYCHKETGQSGEREQWLEPLVAMLREWDKQSRWPDSMRQAMCVLIPMSQAQNDAQIRPIGLLQHV